MNYLHKIIKLKNQLDELNCKKESNQIVNLLKTSQQVYTIKSGDNLSKLSGGDQRYLKLIIEANPDLDPDNLSVGQKITLPPKPAYPNSNMTYSQGLVNFIKRHEGNPRNGEAVLTPYDDGSGNITIGWGHKLGKKGDSINQPPINSSTAEAILKKDLDKASDFVKRNVDSKLNQHQFDALVSLVFNAGPTAVHQSDLFRQVDSGNFLEAAKIFPTTLVGTNIGGIQKRRVEETAIFTSGTGV